MFQFDNDEDFDFDLENLEEQQTCSRSIPSISPQSQKENSSPSPDTSLSAGNYIADTRKTNGSQEIQISTRPLAGKRPRPSSPHNDACSETRQKYVRKFPGPAGIILLDASKEKTSSPIGSRRYDLEKGNGFDIDWNRILDKLGLGFLTTHDLGTIVHVKHRMADTKSLTSRVSFLVAAVKEIEHSFQDVPCVLADMSGEIIGSIHQPVVDRYGKYLRKGSVLVLRNVSILLPKSGRQKTYLSVTMKNLVAVYSLADDHVTKLQPFSSSEVRKWIAEETFSTTASRNRPEDAYQQLLVSKQVAKTTTHQVETNPTVASDMFADFFSGVDDDLFDNL